MPLQIGVILNKVTIPPLILLPRTICNQRNGIPNINERIRNCTRKLAVK